MSNVRALQTQSRFWHMKRQSACSRIVCPQAIVHCQVVAAFGQARSKFVVEPVSPSNIRQESQGSSELRHAHSASDRLQLQSVVGASRRRAAPGSQSVDSGALPGSGQLTSSSKRVGRVCWQSCALSSIALTLPSNGHPTAGHTGSLRHG